MVKKTPMNPVIRAATTAYIRELLENLLPAIRRAVRPLGYAVAVHGSLARDIDLIAVPWVEDARMPQDVVRAVEATLTNVLGHCALLSNGEEEATPRPHGRHTVTFVLPETHVWIDFSIMSPLPPIPLPGAKP